MTSPARARDGPGTEERELLLEVRLNGALSPAWWKFVEQPDGALAITADRLALLGFDLRALGVASDTSLVRLSDLKGVTYRYSEADQSIELEVADAALVPVVLDSGRAPGPIDPDRVEGNIGALLNYGAFLDASGDGAQGSGLYDFRVLLGRSGLLSSTGLVDWIGNTSDGGVDGAPGGFDHIRLDTSWRYIDVRRVLAFTLGDSIADGGQMGAAYRFAGIQVRRDYSDRPDLVTMALPVLTASAAVPSTIDLYINGMRLFTGQVARGPFQFRSLPNIGGGATATVVLTDAMGQEKKITKQIFFVPGLLPRGRLDYSVEAGFPREGYGVRSSDYDMRPVGSASVRYGLVDWLTLLGHVEGASGLVNGSLGATTRIGDFGALTGGLAVSRFGGRTGLRYSLDMQARLRGVNLYGGLERSGSDYNDIVTAIADRSYTGIVRGNDGLPQPILSAYSRRTGRVGASFTVLKTGFSLSYTHLRVSGQDLRLASASLSRTLFNHLSLWTSAYKDFSDSRGYGVFVGLSLSFGRGLDASTSLSKTSSGTTLNSRVSNSPGLTEGRLGWDISSNEPLSGEGSPYRAADFSYRTSLATFGAGLAQEGDRIHVTGSIEGAVVVMGGGVFFSPRIDNSFAIIRNAGPDIPVLSNTRPVTRTGGDGRALVPVLNSLQPNTVSIDPTDLAIDLRPARTEVEVIPADRGGVIIDFGVAPDPSALVTLVDEAGKPLPVGSFVTLDSQHAVVGYDGRVYLRELATHNRIHVQRELGPDCEAGFDFAPQPGKQVSIGPITCRNVQ